MGDVISFKEAKPAEEKCSFCGKLKSKAKRLVKSELGPCICDECVAACKARLGDAAG